MKRGVHAHGCLLPQTKTFLQLISLGKRQGARKLAPEPLPRSKADARLMGAVVTPANRSRMLQAVKALQVVEHGYSHNYCAHHYLNASQLSLIHI